MSGGDVLGVFDLLHRAREGAPGIHLGFRMRSPMPPVGGGACALRLRRSTPRGPSPRGRGSRGVRPDYRPTLGWVPAWAGEPMDETVVLMRVERVHPRVGGGAVERSAAWSRRRSRVHPRVGGEPAPVHVGRVLALGSIPAWAGEPSAVAGLVPRTRVHPRVGGGASLAENQRA